jgi:transcriptional regulator with XRE-family HTH domain
MSHLAEEVSASRLPRPVTRRDIRLAAGVSQARLADELGINRVSLARYECGMREPQGELRKAYAALLRELAGLA